MASVAARRWPMPRIGALAAGLPGTAVGLLALVAASVFLRTRAIGAGYWLDEGLSIGLASHPLLDIPGLLRQDGSPPLYYLVLHAWMDLFGSGEAATRALSLVFAVLAVPAGFWAGRSLFGRWAGWVCAVLAGFNPFLTAYSQEARMYALLVPLGLVATAAFLHAFAFRRRRYVPLFAAALAAMLYTHNWSLFFAAGAAVAVAPCLLSAPDRRRALLDAATAFGAAAVLFAPWIPSLVFQAMHTGAPWARAASLEDLGGGLARALGGAAPATALLLGAGAGLAALVRRPPSATRTAALAAALLPAALLPAATLALAWLSSRVGASPWAFRYLAVAIGPLLVLAALGISRAGRLGAIALALTAVLWGGYRAPDEKSNVREVAAASAGVMAPGDLVVSTHPEHLPVLHHYLPPGLRYATSLGPVADPRVMDWRDAFARLRAARPEVAIEPVLAGLPAGRRILLARPIVDDGRGWNAPWTRLVRRRSAQWWRALATDRRFVSIAADPGLRPGTRDRGIRARVYLKVRAG